MSMVDRLRRREGLPSVVTVGGEPVRTLQNRLMSSRSRVFPGANEIMVAPDFPILQDPVKIKLKKLSFSDLGFKGWPEFKQVVDAANERGFDLVPAETALHLRLAYESQPIGEVLVMGMDPIMVEDLRRVNKYPRVFFLGHGYEGTFVSHYWTDMGPCWGQDSKFVFAERK